MSHKPSLGGRLALSLFMLILILMGIKMLVGAVRQLQESREAMGWPTVPGQVLRSQMKTHTQSVRRKSGDGIRRSYQEEHYTADIEYGYAVNQIAYKGTRISAVQGGTLADKPHVQLTLDQYPVGKAVTVSYNPKDPRGSVLEPGSWGGFLVWAGLSLFLILLPLGVLWVTWHPKHSRMISGL